jgi:hypothetical protein
MSEALPDREGRYRHRVTAAAAPGSGGVPPASTPREVRAALLPEEIGQFDSEWRTAMSRSAETLDLTEVYATLERWRRIAALTRADPEAHRRMLQLAARRLAGEETPMVAADEVRARVAQRLGR